MNHLLFIYAIIITILFFAFFMLYLLHKHQIHTLNQKIRFIKKGSTNISLTAEFPSKDIYDLVNAINDLLYEYQENLRDTEKQNLAVKETITNLAHDLRTPLTAISGYSQMLLHSESLSTQDHENVSIILERVNALTILLNQLFEFARLESGEITFSNKKLNLNALLKKVIAAFYQQFEEKNVIPDIRLSNDTFSFYGDENAITRIFNNIIYNALIHGTDCYLFRSTIVDGNYEFCFQNSTDSISTQDVAQLFERFYTTDKSRSKKTTGLGLSIAKKLVLEMGGTIEAVLAGNLFSIIIKFPIKKN